MGFSGAGGSNGGTGRFFLGLIMMIGGGYLFLNSIHVGNSFGMGSIMFGMGGVNMTGGMVLVPFIFGVAMIFYNSENWLGWILVGASLVMLTFGVIASIHFHFQRMTAFTLLMILALLLGGIGLFLSSLRNFE